MTGAGPKSAMRGMLVAVCAAALALAALPAVAAAKGKPRYREAVSTLPGFPAAGTPKRLNEVRILKQGSPRARNVLVLVPGTSGGAAYFRPFAHAFVKRMPNYQVWSVERRENLLEDHSRLDRARARKLGVGKLFDYYLGWITDSSVQPHFEGVPDAEVPFARRWGMRVADGDLRRVVRRAGRGGRTVVLGGHSLGGTIATAYASWDFRSGPGARDIAGLVLIDGGSLGGSPPSPADARDSLDALAHSSPFLDLIGLGLPWAAGVFNAVGSSAAMQAPRRLSVFDGWPLLPASLRPPEPATNRGGYGYALDADTGPPNLALVQVHVGHLATSGNPRDWVNGELGTVRRAANAFRGIRGMDGTAWYHPRRLTIDGGAVNNGIRNPAQRVLGVRATHGDDVHVPIYAFETSLGFANGTNRVVRAARQLARQSGVRGRDLRTVSKPRTYAHIDPLTAAPRKNAFLKTLVPFLRQRVR